MWEGIADTAKKFGITNFWAVISAVLFIISIASPGNASAVQRVSVDSAGIQADNAGLNPSISSDGRYIAFESKAGNLVAGDDNGKRHIFVHDAQTGETVRVSVNSSGVEADDASFNASISGDGRYVAFDSKSDDLEPFDDNGVSDIFVHDRQTGQTIRVSVASYEGEDEDSWNPSISADGRYVAFESLADNLVAGDGNEVRDIFVHDMQTGATVRANVDSAGFESEFVAWNPSISGDGRYVSFDSVADDLVADDTNDKFDIFVHDMQTGATVRASLDSTGVEGDDESRVSSISADGRYVAFESKAENLVAGDDSGKDIFVHDLQTGATTRVNVNSAGVEANDKGYNPSISADGRYVAFESRADNLVAGDNNEASDIFVHDRQTGETKRVSVDAAGIEGNDASSAAAISADGAYVAFESDASNFVAGDTNVATDIFWVPLSGDPNDPGSVPDVTPPVISIPASITVEASGITTPVPALGVASASDDVDGAVPVTHDALASFPLGVTTVTYTATDTAGNVAMATQAVIIQDTTAPIISAPAAVSAQSPDGNPVIITLTPPTATDIFSVTITNDAPAAFPVGEATVTWTAADANGNSATATQLVTVSFADAVPPVVSAPPGVMAEASGAATVVALGAATATDNIDGPVPVSNDAPAGFPAGTTTVTYTASDAAGNTATATQAVTITDTTPPSISIQQLAVTVEATASQMAVDLGSVTATDLVDGGIAPTSDAPAAFPLDVTQVTWTATDAAGNTVTAVQTVTVQDTTPPVITAPAAIAVDSPSGQPLTVDIGLATASDAFTPVDVTHDAPVVFPIGATTVTWTASDANGNSATATQTVTVNDTSFLANLPPDPGPAGEATLEGIDSDNDDVRDDVQRWIALNFPDSEKTRAALTQRAKAFQQFLLNVIDAQLITQNAQKIGWASECLGYVRQNVTQENDAYEINRQFKAIYLNTSLRSRTWLQADQHLSGSVFSLLPDPKLGCSFNPDSMSN